jgi:DNA-directed RNA polymerase subunit RPC12/RpoP
MKCPQCGKRMTMDFKTSKVLCPHCGYVRTDEISRIEDTAQAAKAKGNAPAVQLIYKGEISPGALAAFESGHDYLYKEDKPQALASFVRAADYQPEFLDAHLWIARVSDDPLVKRDRLDNILAQNPNQLEALREKMVLDGKLTHEQAYLTTQDREIEVHKVDGVAAKATELLCPSCGGHLTVNELARRVECRFCGYSTPQTTQHGYGAESLALALLQRKAQVARWNVGKRVVKCQQCGAEHTIPAEKMSQRCRFCGSTQVILSDALDTFEQPDKLIPFSTTAEQAQEVIDRELHSIGERFLSLFQERSVERSVVEGVYLPFWAFDVMCEITKTVTTGNFQHEVYKETDGMLNVCICAVKSPSPVLVSHAGGYDMSATVPYEPKWLAKYPAQIYNVDFDAASLQARAIVSKHFRTRYEQVAKREMRERQSRYENYETVSVSTQIQSMSFQLVLLPIWIATMTEKDGDVRVAVVNAQTGKTALGRAERPTS